MSPVEEALSYKFLPKILGLESISGWMRKILDIGYKRAGLFILNLIEVSDKVHRTSLACRVLLVESLITGEDLYTSEHRACERQSIRNGREIQEERKEAHIDKEKRSETSMGRQRDRSRVQR